MEDGLAAASHVAQARGVADVDLFEPHLRGRGQVLERPFGQIVDRHHVVALCDYPSTQMRPDEPGGAGDQEPHPRVILVCPSGCEPRLTSVPCRRASSR